MNAQNISLLYSQDDAARQILDRLRMRVNDAKVTKFRTVENWSDLSVTSHDIKRVFESLARIGHGGIEHRHMQGAVFVWDKGLFDALAALDDHTPVANTAPPRPLKSVFAALAKECETELVVLSKMRELREAIGAGRLGRKVRESIATELDLAGLTTFPKELPSNQDEEVRVMLKGSLGAILTDVTINSDTTSNTMFKALLTCIIKTMTTPETP